MKKLVIILTVVLFISIIMYSFSNKNEKKYTPVTIRLKWLTQTQFAGYYVALEKGYYKDEGLDVSIKQGKYGKNPLLTVANEVEEFGVQWAGDLIANEGDLISLANIVKDNGFYLVSKKNRNIKKISDFKGKKISTWLIGHEYQLSSLLDKYQIKSDEYNLVSQKWDLSQFYNDEVDVASAMSYNEFLEILNNGYNKEDLNYFSFKEFGVRFLGQCIFTTRNYYQNNKDVCRKLVKASLKGWQDAIRNPAEATEIVMKHDTEKILEKTHQLKQMYAMIPLIDISHFELGFQYAKHFSFIDSLYEAHNILKKSKPVKSYFTNEFIK